MSAGWPYSATGMIARVRDVITRSICAASILQSVRLDVDEHWCGADQHDRFGGGDERERRRDHFIAGLERRAPLTRSTALRCRTRP
jgi:hypothetical protein